jgi:pyruvate formate lyase activating enzyme
MKTNGHCSVCIRECETGNSFCHRRDEKGRLKQNNILCAINYDYLYDKPITHFNGNVKIMSIGSWGCNLRCSGCQNSNLSWSESGDKLGFKEMTPGDVVEAALKNDCQGICFTYNEPAILLETVESIAFKAKEKGLLNIFVTNCTLTEKSAKRISKCIDAVAADIKSLNDKFYYEYCGAAGINDVANKILLCIKTLNDSGCHVEVRTNIIPGGNDQPENYYKIASWIKDNLDRQTPWHITRFFPAHKLAHLTRTPTESLYEAQNTGIEVGLENVHIYPDKGCDCAKDTFLIGNEKSVETPSAHCCCNKQ